MLLTSHDTIKLADLGVSKMLEGTDHAFTIIGTRPYMSPEVHKGIKYLSNTDVW